MAINLAVILSSILVIGLLGLAFFLDTGDVAISEATGLVVTAESFPVYMETHPLMNDMPASASIDITIGGHTYGIEGNRIVPQSVDEPDISIILPAGYESRIGEVGLCAATKEALKAGDLTVDTLASKTTLLLKYRGLLKYRQCLEV